MTEPKRPAYQQAWDILKEVDDLLLDESDAKGNINATGEAKALNRMRKALIREIDRDATEFLKRNGFNGYGLKKKH